MTSREFSEEERKALAAEGKAMPDGSYPTPDRDALHRAVQAYGRETGDKAALRRYLVRRAYELGCPEEIPESWHVRRAE